MDCLHFFPTHSPFFLLFDPGRPPNRFRVTGLRGVEPLRTSTRKTYFTYMASPTKKTIRFFQQSTTGSTSTSIFLRTMFRNSATTPGSPLIRKFTPCDRLFDALNTVWQSGSSVSRSLGTATLSLKLGIMFPKISYHVTFFFYLYSTKTQCFLSTFLCLSRHLSSRLRRR